MYFSAIHFSLAFCGSKVVLNFLEAWLRKVMLLITSDLLQPDSRVRPHSRREHPLKLVLR